MYTIIDINVLIVGCVQLSINLFSIRCCYILLYFIFSC